MKITIESTTRKTDLVDPTSGAVTPARIWEGQTESGIPVICFVALVAVREEHDQSEFERELDAHQPPSSDARIFPTRMVL